MATEVRWANQVALERPGLVWDPADPVSGARSERVLSWPPGASSPAGGNSLLPKYGSSGSERALLPSDLEGERPFVPIPIWTVRTACHQFRVRLRSRATNQPHRKDSR